MLDTKALAEATALIVRQHVETATAPLLKRLADLEARQPEKGEVGAQGEKGEAGADGRDGADADMQAVAAMIDEAVAKAIADIPPPERGEKGEAGDRGEKGEAGDAGKDGNGIADLLIDRDGNLVATMDDGRMKSLGVVIGKDGVNGERGTDGRDGFGLDDFDIVPTDERTIEMSFTRGDTKHTYELAFPVMIDQGVFKEGDSYVRGDAVSWGGSLWVAQRSTDAKPDGPDSGWRLAVKRGRDGRDAAK